MIGAVTSSFQDHISAPADAIEPVRKVESEATMYALVEAKAPMP
jgi:hypothetical protein